MITDEELQLQGLQKSTGSPQASADWLKQALGSWLSEQDRAKELSEKARDPMSMTREEKIEYIRAFPKIKAARQMNAVVSNYFRGVVPGMAFLPKSSVEKEAAPFGGIPASIAGLLGMMQNPLAQVGTGIVGNYAPRIVTETALGQIVKGAAVGAIDAPLLTGDPKQIPTWAGFGAAVGIPFAIGAKLGGANWGKVLDPLSTQDAHFKRESYIAANRGGAGTNRDIDAVSTLPKYPTKAETLALEDALGNSNALMNEPGSDTYRNTIDALREPPKPSGAKALADRYFNNPERRIEAMVQTEPVVADATRPLNRNFLRDKIEAGRSKYTAKLKETAEQVRVNQIDNVHTQLVKAIENKLPLDEQAEILKSVGGAESKEVLHMFYRYHPTEATELASFISGVEKKRP